MEPIFTVTEVAKVLRAIEGRFALTPRGIRYYARTGMVVPSGRLPKQKRVRATRLYTLTDVTLLRLVSQLHRQRVHERALWGLLVYRGAELRAVIARGRGMFVVEAPAALAIGSEDAGTPKPIRVDVATLLRGLPERLAAFRARRPKIWTGFDWIEATQAARQAAL